MSLFIYIDDVLVDLYPNTLFSYTYQNTLINSLNTRRTSYSNAVKLPFTPTNDNLYERARDEKSQGRAQYRALDCRVIQNGVEIISFAKAVLKKAFQNYEVVILTGTYGISEALADETIDDLYEINTSLITWDASQIDSVRAATSGVVAPYLSYGQINFPQILFNTDFDLPGFWENIGTSFLGDTWQWPSLTTYADIQLSAGTTNPTQDRSPQLTQKYQFYEGQEYTIYVTGYIDSNTIYNLVTIGVGDIGTFSDFIVGQFTFDSVEDTYSASFLCPRNYDSVYVVASIDNPAATTTRVFFINSVTIDVVHRIGNVYYPSIYYKDIFSKLIENAGYTVSGSVLTSSIYTNLIIPFCKQELKYTGFFNQCREFEAERTGVQSITVDGRVIFNTILSKDLFGYYNPTTGLYDQGGSYQQTVSPDSRSFYARFYVRLKVQLVSGTASVSISASNGTIPLASQLVSQVGVNEVILQVTNWEENTKGYNIEAGDNIGVYVDLTGVGAQLNILTGSFRNEVDGINQESTPRFYACEILPQIKKRDLFKDFCLRFGIIPKETDSRELVLKTINEVLNSQSDALDWTNKRDATLPDEIVFEQGLSQNNYFKYPSKDDLFFADAGQGNLSVQNENLEFESDLYTSLYNGTRDFTLGAASYVYAAFIPLYEEAPTVYPTNDENRFADPGYRLLLVRSKQSSEASVKYNGTARTDYKIANFIPTGIEHLSFTGFIKDNYSFLIEALKNNKIITRYYNLNEEDIKAIDPHKLVYDNGSYFYINKVFDYVFGQVTKVELLKVG